MLFDTTVPELITRAVILIVAFSVHEFAHAWTADNFGDNLPRIQGRVTLNPLVHLDPFGSLMLLLTGIGWAKPVQITPSILQMASPNAMMMVAFAGPLSNLLLAILAAIPLKFGMITYAPSGAIMPSLYEFLFYFVAINLLLMIFNLLPLAPLDGFTVAMHFLPDAGKQILARVAPFSMIILMMLIVTRVFSLIVGPILQLAMRILVL